MRNTEEHKEKIEKIMVSKNLMPFYVAVDFSYLLDYIKELEEEIKTLNTEKYGSCECVQNDFGRLELVEYKPQTLTNKVFK